MYENQIIGLVFEEKRKPGAFTISPENPVGMERS